MIVPQSYFIRIRLLGDCSISLKSGEDITPKSKKLRAVIAYLASSHRGSATREKLAGLLWSTRGEQQARDSLRQALAEARRQLNCYGEEWILSPDRDTVAIDLDKVWIDVREVVQLAGSSECNDHLRILESYQGPFLDSLTIHDPAFEDWLLQERRVIEERIKSPLRRLLQSKVARDQQRSALNIALFLFALDPTDEDVHCQLMMLYAKSGDVPAAIQQFRRMCDILKERLDAKPSPESYRLYESIASRSVEPSKVQSIPASIGPGSLRDHHTSLAVLPFENRSLSGESDGFARTIADEVTACLTRFHWLAVVGIRSAAYTLKQTADLLDLGRRLNVDYLLDGGVICAGDQVRLNVSLVECFTGHTLWGDRMTFQIRDIFNTLDRVVALITNRLESQLRIAEIKRAINLPNEALLPQHKVMRAIPLMYKMTRESLEESLELLHSAIDSDPSNSTAYSWRAFWELIAIGQNWTTDRKLSSERIDFYTRAALEHDQDDPFALCLRGHVEAFVFHDYQRALAYFDRALRINPDFAYGWGFSAFTHSYLGDAEKALRHLEQYRKLCPVDPFPHFVGAAYCIAHSFSGNHEAAVQHGLKVVGHNPNDFAAYRPLIASLGNVGRIDEARKYLTKLQQNDSDFTIDWFRTRYPPLPQESRDQFIAGLRRVGVPED